MSTTLFGLASLLKYTSDYIKLRKDRGKSAKEETFRDYLEACRRRDHLELHTRFDWLTGQIVALEQLIEALRDQEQDQINIVLAAIRDGNTSLLSTIRTIDHAWHAKLDRIIHLLDVTPRQLFPSEASIPNATNATGFEGKYLARCRSEFGRLEMLGIPDTRDIHQDLSIAYANLEMGTLTDEQTAQSSVGRADTILSQYRQLTVRGPAGSGKTTLLRWIALQCATSNSIPENSWRGGIPFFVPLRKLPAANKGKPQELLLHEYAFDAGNFDSPPPNWVEEVFSGQRAVLLLDGLDELSTAARPNFWQWLLQLLRLYPRTRVVVTSRHLSATDEEMTLEWQPPLGFAHSELHDLIAQERTVFIQKWHEAAIHVTDDLVRKSQLETSCSTLIDKLQDAANGRVADLCKSPLTAALICALFWRNLSLPTTRRELYEGSCKMLMKVRDECAGVEVDEVFKGVELSDKMYLLECLAWEMMQNARAC